MTNAMQMNSLTTHPPESAAHIAIRAHLSDMVNSANRAVDLVGDEHPQLADEISKLADLAFEIKKKMRARLDVVA